MSPCITICLCYLLVLLRVTMKKSSYRAGKVGHVVEAELGRVWEAGEPCWEPRRVAPVKPGFGAPSWAPSSPGAQPSSQDHQAPPLEQGSALSLLLLSRAALCLCSWSCFGLTLRTRLLADADFCGLGRQYSGLRLRQPGLGHQPHHLNSLGPRQNA